MPRISEVSTLSGGTSLWSVNRLSDMMWGFFNIMYFYFRSLLDPLINPGGDSRTASRSGSGRGPPRPPGRGNFRTFADAFGNDSIPPPPPGG
ncbi:hypothetical protein TNIN_90301 [Trichonephila inaurata madagascariensis]|uniref:Selenoprotein K n=1 Tax=Trichonephila inaurata madagascariensis TaxID=2747483 RepID=A0A8X6X7L8_9ARAC|nr:hypothetical protein TNIN_90301 [Trichonephila inaurata madagascariensis]